MNFSTLLEKMLSGRPLSPAEKQTMIFEARKLEQAERLLTSLIQSGTQRLNIDQLQARDVSIENGVVSLGDDGIQIESEGSFLNDNAYKFVDENGDVFAAFMALADPDLDLNWAQTVTTSSQNGLTSNYNTLSAVGSFARASMVVDRSALTDNGEVELIQGSSGTRVNFKNVEWLRLTEAANSPGINPTQGTELNLYMKGDKLVIQFNDGGTMRYKYLDLTGTGVTWQHSTTAP